MLRGGKSTCRALMRARVRCSASPHAASSRYVPEDSPCCRRRRMRRQTEGTRCACSVLQRWSRRSSYCRRTCSLGGMQSTTRTAWTTPSSHTWRPQRRPSCVCQSRNCSCYWWKVLCVGSKRAQCGGARVKPRLQPCGKVVGISHLLLAAVEVEVQAISTKLTPCKAGAAPVATPLAMEGEDVHRASR